jgi:hypothetical protein
MALFPNVIKRWIPRTRVGLAAVIVLACAAYQQEICGAQSHIYPPSHKEIEQADQGAAGTTFIPLDSWMYDAAARLYAKGYLPTAYLGFRPWTRASLAHMLVLSAPDFQRGLEADDEASDIYARLTEELHPEIIGDHSSQMLGESVYFRARQIEGDPLNDGFHAGQSIVNDYGRTYQPGFNSLVGYSALARAWRTAVYFRGEYLHVPSGTGYSYQVASYLSAQDGIPLLPAFTVPYGQIVEVNRFRVVEAEASLLLGNNQIAFGKNDAWLGPAMGGSFAISNNAESIYSFQINRTDPLYIPGLSRIAGLFRYSFEVGSLKWHSSPNDPWIHAEKISFKPTSDLEFGFTRLVIWGGKGHVPITAGTFLRSFFSGSGVTPAVKMSSQDPGARFSIFDFQWRIPWHANLASIYTDSLVHDDVSPIANPARAAFRSGILITRLPKLPRWDLRLEGAYTDIHDRNSYAGVFFMTEYIQKQGTTNRGMLFGDPIGREAKGGQAWLTYHPRPDEYLQFEYRNAKVADDFVPYGTTQQNGGVNFVWRPFRFIETRASVHAEIWRAPFIASGVQKDANVTFQLTYYPHHEP